MKGKSVEERLKILGEIILFLSNKGMEKYSVQIYADYTAVLRYGTQPVKKKDFEGLLTYLKRTFKE